MSTNQAKIIDTTELDLGISGPHSRVIYRVIETDDGKFEVWMYDPQGRKIDSCSSDLEAQLSMHSFVISAREDFGAVEVSPFG
jgi:hypothetical protein